MGHGELDVLVSGTSAGWLVEFETSQQASGELNNLQIWRPAGALDAAGVGAGSAGGGTGNAAGAAGAGNVA